VLGEKVEKLLCDVAVNRKARTGKVAVVEVATVNAAVLAESHRKRSANVTVVVDMKDAHARIGLSQLLKLPGRASMVKRQFSFVSHGHAVGFGGLRLRFESASRCRRISESIA
jgi:hypothetical protein